MARVENDYFNSVSRTSKFPYPTAEYLPSFPPKPCVDQRSRLAGNQDREMRNASPGSSFHRSIDEIAQTVKSLEKMRSKNYLHEEDLRKRKEHEKYLKDHEAQMKKDPFYRMKSKQEKFQLPFFQTYVEKSWMGSKSPERMNKSQIISSNQDSFNFGDNEMNQTAIDLVGKDNLNKFVAGISNIERDPLA